MAEKRQTKQDKEVDQFFDASDRTAGQMESESAKLANKENPAAEVVGINQKAEKSSWIELKRVMASITERVIPQKDDKNNPLTTEQMIISIKDEHKRELQVEEDNAKSDVEDSDKSKDKDKKDTEIQKIRKMREL